MTDTKNILIKARDIIKERGVTRDGDYIDDAGCKVCSLGAVQLALGATVEFSDGLAYIKHPSMRQEDYWKTEEFKEYMAYFREADAALIAGAGLKGSEEYISIPDWNDDTETDEEVFAAFDKAIELAG